MIKAKIKSSQTDRPSRRESYYLKPPDRGKNKKENQCHKKGPNQTFFFCERKSSESCRVSSPSSSSPSTLPFPSHAPSLLLPSTSRLLYRYLPFPLLLCNLVTRRAQNSLAFVESSHRSCIMTGFVSSWYCLPSHAATRFRKALRR